MNVTCPECSSVFRVDPAKIPLAGVRARCSVCGGVIAIGERGRIDDDFTASAPAPQLAQTPPRQRPSVSAPLPPRPPVTMPTPPQPMHAGFASQAGAAPPPQPRTSADTSMPSRPSAVTPPSDRVAVPTQPRETPPRAPVVPAAPPPAPPPAAPRMSPFAPISSPQPSMPSMPSMPSAPGTYAPQRGAPPAAPPASAPVAPPAQRSVPPAQPAHPPAAAAGAPTARPPINPFLANDPNQKAKRLARALVSDIIAYFPDRHAQGKRDGTLRESFREEIKKSYEEYVEQMGKEFAENTTHFQDALNDVLAGGAKIF
jgi:predicted Zn finger-like uncharacterized protein